MYVQIASHLKTSDLPDDNTPHSVDSIAPYVTGKGIASLASKSVLNVGCRLLLPDTGQLAPLLPESH